MFNRNLDTLYIRYIYIYIYIHTLLAASSWKMKMKRNVSSDRDSIIRGNDI